MRESIRQSQLRQSQRKVSDVPRHSDYVKLDIQPTDSRPRYTSFSKRHFLDADYLGMFDDLELFPKKCEPKASQILSRHPSYTNFKVPFQMVCKERYLHSRKNYDQQFVREIQKIIDNQATAREATYFVRIVSFTTLWPPYHNEKELVDTSRNFYRLTPKEQTRFQYIMSNNFS